MIARKILLTDRQTNVTEEGWEEWVTGEDGGVFLLKADETAEMEIKDGYIIHLDAPALLELVSE